MICKNCGEVIDNNATVCPKCGASQVDNAIPPVAPEGSGFGWGVLGFLIPLVGIILFFVWKDTKPNSARASLIGAVISIVIGVLLRLMM
ncbi:MAG: zinc ribbon domain-containing protein [Butyrivibrio sp.]|nr:zinc ribbon domain-containing protein [Butyrivibrio sp.]